MCCAGEEWLGLAGCRQATVSIAKNFLDQFSQNFTSTSGLKWLASRNGSADAAQAFGQILASVKFVWILSVLCLNNVQTTGHSACAIWTRGSYVGSYHSACRYVFTSLQASRTVNSDEEAEVIVQDLGHPSVKKERDPRLRQLCSQSASRLAYGCICDRCS